MIRALFIDDQLHSTETTYIVNLLRKFEEFYCVEREPNSNFDKLFDERFDVLLIDFDLATGTEADGKSISFHGTSAATEFRLRQPDAPIILFTRKAAIAGIKSELALNRDSNIDLLIFKETVMDQPDATYVQIRSLVYGFQRLSSLKSRDVNSICSLMGASAPQEIDQLVASMPNGNPTDWSNPEIARWILQVVMRYPGILRDRLYAATKLGVTVDAFEMAQVEEFFKKAKYSGIFADFGDWWWSNRLVELATELMTENDIYEPMALGFRKAFKEATSIDIEPTHCNWDTEPGADQVCYVLQEPVRLIHTIPYHPDARPRVMDIARVSRKALRTSNNIDATRLDSVSYDAVAETWGLELK